MLLFKKINFVVEPLDDEKKHCKFLVSPLFKNFGITLGNALRRTLLNSLPGMAIFAVEIKGVEHEFTVIPGIIEGVTEIIFNLRKVIFKNKNFDNNEIIKLKIDKKGPGLVLAEDIEKHPMIEIINPKAKIANLTDKGSLTMVLYICQGIGYATAEINKIEHELNEKNLIYVDSNYSSILNVSYKVDVISAQESSDVYEKLVLDVHTNGLFTPQEAVANAANILMAHLEKFVNIKQELQKIVFKEDLILKQKVENEEITVNDLDLSVRSTNCLIKANINTLEELSKKTFSELKNIENLGTKSLYEILEKMNSMNIKIKGFDKNDVSENKNKKVKDQKKA